VAPTGRNTVVQNGSVDRICPQAYPAWLAVGDEFVAALIAGNGSTFNTTAVVQQLEIEEQNAPPAQLDPRTTEDCLFLDVIVPKKVFDGANSNSRIKRRQSSGAPVVVWIYGGGYTGGYKTSSGIQMDLSHQVRLEVAMASSLLP
jgi:acetyl esterase/lipase